MILVSIRTSQAAIRTQTRLEEDPWMLWEETFAVGSIHEGTVIRKDDKGAIVQIAIRIGRFLPPTVNLK